MKKQAVQHKQQMKKKVKCRDYFKCNENECPAYRSEDLRCWLASGTHCRNGTQREFLEKVEMCLECEPFKANIDVDSMAETLKVVGEGLAESRRMVAERDKKLEGINNELSLGLSEVFQALGEISSGNPEVRIPETSGIELIAELKQMVNLTAENLGEIVELSHEFAIGLAEHFDVLHRVAKGNLSARIPGTSRVELLDSLSTVTNKMIESVSAEIAQRKTAEEALRKQKHELGKRVKELNCLYRISELVTGPNISFDELIQQVADLIPPSWQYPEITCARIVLEGREFRTENFGETAWKQISDIIVNGKRAGALQVCHSEQRPESDEGPFLKEERALLNTIAERVGRIIEQKQADEEKSKLEAQLQQALKMEAIGTLAGGIAHDFNNLLMAAQGNISLMLDDIDPTHPHYQGLKNVEKQIISGATLTRQILGYARGGQYNPRPINLNEIMAETFEAFRRTRKDTTIHLEPAEDLYAIEADQGQIEQVLLNLCVNATDAMPGGGELTLKTINITNKDMKGKLYDPKPGHYALLTVTDTGKGMDKETQERMFEPFFTTKEMGRGTGLGLASAYGIIKSHGGYIDVESEIGRGTMFSICLPATEKTVEKTVAHDEQITGGSGTVLLADDEEMVLDVGARILERLGYTVLAAKGGKEAVEIYKAKQDKIDLVMLDMIMPDMGGGETYDRIRQINPNVKVLLSSGYSIDSEAKEILKRGCNGFIQKPFGMKELSRKIEVILEKE